MENILGVKVDNLTKKEILEKIRNFLVEPNFHQIATINPEFILEAQKNPEFKNILNNCDLNVADGVGIRLAFWQFGNKLKARFAGADLMLEILKIASEQNIAVFLAVNKNGLSTFEEIRNAILRIYPDLEIYGENIDINTRSFAFAQDDKNNPRIVFVNFGAPHQELFINSQKCDTIRLAMGVGGSFDFLTGKIRRAPRFMQIIGLEWLWRIFQPQEWKFKKERLKRIFRATIFFTIKIMFNK